jgi:hypothetical protein
MALTKVTRATTLIKDGWGAFNTLIDDLLSVANGKGASQVGIEDTAGNMSAANVEDALAEIYTDHATTKTLAETFDENPATTTGLVWGYKGGLFRLDSTVTTVAAGTIALTDDATNYIEIDPSDGLVKKNTTSFTSGRIPIRTVLTASGSQTTSTDKRAWFTQVAGATETTSGTVELATDAETITGTATDRVVTPANIVARAASVSTIATDPAWAAAGDLVQGTGNDTAAVLSLGAANLPLRVNAAATSIEYSVGSKILSYTRDVAIAAGNQTLSGAGFTPTKVKVHLFYITSVISGHGFYDGTTYWITSFTSSYPTDPISETGYLLKGYTSTGNQFLATLTFNADGGVLAWTKTNSPAGTLTFVLEWIR